MVCPWSQSLEASLQRKTGWHVLPTRSVTENLTDQFPGLNSPATITIVLYRENSLVKILLTPHRHQGSSLTSCVSVTWVFTVPAVPLGVPNYPCSVPVVAPALENLWVREQSPSYSLCEDLSAHTTHTIDSSSSLVITLGTDSHHSQTFSPLWFFFLENLCFHPVPIKASTLPSRPSPSHTQPIHRTCTCVAYTPALLIDEEVKSLLYKEMRPF